MTKRREAKLNAQYIHRITGWPENSYKILILCFKLEIDNFIIIGRVLKTKRNIRILYHNLKQIPI